MEKDPNSNGRARLAVALAPSNLGIVYGRGNLGIVYGRGNLGIVYGRGNLGIVYGFTGERETSHAQHVDTAHDVAADFSPTLLHSAQ